MTRLDSVRAELTDLSGIIQDFVNAELEEWSPEWMTLQSLVQRQADLLHEARLLEGAADVQIKLVGGAERTHLVDAEFLGEFLRELQSAVSSIVQVVMHGETTARGALPGDVIAASMLRVGAAQAGSFEVLMDGPYGRAAQLTVDGQQELPPFDEAVDRLMDLIDGAEGEQLTERLQRAVADIGSERALNHIGDLARALARTGTSATIVQRSIAMDEPRESRITSVAAERLQQFLSRTEQTTSIVYLVGQLSGVRWTSGSFDLEVTRGDQVEVIRGRVVRDLRDAVRPAFDTIVRAELEQTVVRTPGDTEGRTTWLLVGLQPVTDL